MQRNTSIIIILVLIVLLGLVFWVSSDKEEMNIGYPEEHEVMDDGDEMVEDDSMSGEAMSYTIADVETHNTREDCWTAIDGGVYDLSAWVDQHPGGDEAIMSLCGIDGSEAFNTQHGGQEHPESTLEGFQIGELAN